MIIAVVDGQGGGIGKSIVERLRTEFPKGKVRIIALGTNAVATGQMLKGGADDGATGENAIVHNMKQVDIVTGVIGILNANAMMGELTPAMAAAIGTSSAEKVLLPVNRCGIHVVRVEEAPLGRHIDNAVSVIKNVIAESGSCY